MSPRIHGVTLKDRTSMESIPSLADGYFVSTATRLPMEQHFVIFCSDFSPRTRSKDNLKKKNQNHEMLKNLLIEIIVSFFLNSELKLVIDW